MILEGRKGRSTFDCLTDLLGVFSPDVAGGQNFMLVIRHFSNKFGKLGLRFVDKRFFQRLDYV